MAVLQPVLPAASRYQVAAVRAQHRSNRRAAQRAEQQHRMSAARFAGLIIALLLGSLIASLLLNTILAADAFTLATLRSEAAALALREEQLAGEVAHLESPARLARKAAALGMVPSTEPGFLSLGEGRIVGGVPRHLLRPRPPAEAGSATLGR